LVRSLFIYAACRNNSRSEVVLFVKKMLFNNKCEVLHFTEHPLRQPSIPTHLIKNLIDHFHQLDKKVCFTSTTDVMAGSAVFGDYRVTVEENAEPRLMVIQHHELPYESVCE
ncbi:hypothetical protein PMAYCL1PPCAC_24711, partial [Pristionchus mayeri]